MVIVLLVLATMGIVWIRRRVIAEFYINCVCVRFEAAFTFLMAEGRTRPRQFHRSHSSPWRSEWWWEIVKHKQVRLVSYNYNKSSFSSTVNNFISSDENKVFFLSLNGSISSIANGINNSLARCRCEFSVFHLLLSLRVCAHREIYKYFFLVGKAVGDYSKLLWRAEGNCFAL